MRKGLSVGSRTEGRLLRIMRLFIEVKEKILFQLQTAIDENHNQVRYLSLVGVLASGFSTSHTPVRIIMA